MNRGRLRLASLLVVAIIAGACGDQPFAGIGEGASDWIGEPTIVTTTTVPVTVPLVLDSRRLKWFNDTIVSLNPDDAVALRDELFARRGGDLIVQASRAEIATLVPEIKFPSSAPNNAEYVTSQIVFDGSGEISDDPTVGFGIWTSEPYTRSRSVAQMAVLWVATDAEGAREVSEQGAELSCARFADATTAECKTIVIDGTQVWSLLADNGRTMVWYDDIYRYELFGRSFVRESALLEMVNSLVPLTELEVTSG